MSGRERARECRCAPGGACECVCARACARARVCVCVCVRVGTQRREAAARAEREPSSRSFSPAQNSGVRAGSWLASALPGTQLAAALGWKPHPSWDPAICGARTGASGPRGFAPPQGAPEVRLMPGGAGDGPREPWRARGWGGGLWGQGASGRGRGRDEVCLNASSLKFSASVVISSLNAYLCHAEIGFIINSWSHSQRLKGPRRFVH